MIYDRTNDENLPSLPPKYLHHSSTMLHDGINNPSGELNGIQRENLIGNSNTLCDKVNKEFLSWVNTSNGESEFVGAHEYGDNDDIYNDTVLKLQANNNIPNNGKKKSVLLHSLENLDHIQSEVLIGETNTNGDTVFENARQYQYSNTLIYDQVNKEYQFWPTDEEYITANQDHETNDDNNYGVIFEYNDDNSTPIPLEQPSSTSNIPNDGKIILLPLFSSIY